ncbi:hypothetical protein IMG5_028540, partial [Ichthyophthirius multifiliis]
VQKIEEENNQKNKNKKNVLINDLSEEDQKLKDNIEQWVQKIQNKDTQISLLALQQLREEVRKSTSSMTSVPKPLKFLKDHYEQLVDYYEKTNESEFKKQYADFLSVISMTMTEKGKQLSLKYIQEGTLNDLNNWGFEYLNHLSADIVQKYQQRLEKNENVMDLINLVMQIVPYFIQNNAEHDAIDLLMEVDKLEQLQTYVNKENFERISLYLQQCSQYCADFEEMEKTLNVNYTISISLKLYINALRIAIRLDNQDKIEKIFKECQDDLTRKQLCFMVARQRIILPNLDEQLTQIASNSFLTDFYMRLAKELDVLDPKTPDQIYKSHLEDQKQNQIESAKANLADTYVNAFVHLGCKKDALMIKELSQKDSAWIYQVKGTGLTAATASLGVINMWDAEKGNDHMSEYLNMSDGYGKMGALIGIGLFSSGVINEDDVAKALLEAELENKDEYTKLGAVIGLGLAYAGSGREDLQELLLPILIDNNNKLQLNAFAALSLGLIHVGKCNEDISQAIVQVLYEYSQSTPKVLESYLTKYFAVAMGLLYLGQQSRSDTAIECLGIIEHDISKFCQIVIEGCAYAGSGNVLKVQKMLHHCLDKVEEDKSAYQQAAVISLALISSSENVGNEMAMRHMNNILQYCELHVKRAVPLALAILNVSNPKINVMDLLIKFSHDDDAELNQRAIFAMGMVSAGTNNSRMADSLRNLSSYYMKESNGKFFVRLAQGLLYMGKGMVSLQPYYSDRFLLNKVGLAGIITTVFSFMDTKNIILGDYHYTMYYLTLAAYPRMLFTLNENNENITINIRVGQSVDTVGQAGKPKKITGFQTHTSPVLISAGERAELADDEYIPIEQTVLENFIVLKKNPDYVPEDEKNKRKQ